MTLSEPSADTMPADTASAAPWSIRTGRTFGSIRSEASRADFSSTVPSIRRTVSGRPP